MMQVQEIMHSDVHIADPNMTIRDAARRMRASNIGALPVGENDRLIGMVTDRDMVMRAIANDRLPWRDDRPRSDVRRPLLLFHGR